MSSSYFELGHQLKRAQSFNVGDVKVRNVIHRYVIQEKEHEILSAKFSPDNGFLASSHSDGSLSIFGSIFGDTLYNIRDSEISFPITAICWRPITMDNLEVQQFRAVGSDGRILMWRPKYSGALKTLLVSETNSYQCIDYAHTGTRFACAGKLP